MPVQNPEVPSRLLWAIAATAVLLGWTGLSHSAPSNAGPKDPGVNSKGVIATVGHDRITEGDIVQQDKKDFDNLEEDNALRRVQLQRKQTEARYRLLERQTDRVLDQKALELEAKARNVDAQIVLADIKVPAVTEEDERAYFEANKARAGDRTFEQLQQEIGQFLAGQRNMIASRQFYDELRRRHNIVSLLAPYRVPVEASGPARGNEHARVTIVEFADFQCPFCSREEATIQNVLKSHPDDVRLVFRQLPLPGAHPDAIGAARAAVCADRQGMFWPMHDAMFQDQNALNINALEETAKRVGLDGDRFSDCLTSPDAMQAVERDAKAADELNIGETPFFLINGRPLPGAVPADKLESTIADELKRVSAKGG